MTLDEAILKALSVKFDVEEVFESDKRMGNDVPEDTYAELEEVIDFLHQLKRDEQGVSE